MASNAEIGRQLEPFRAYLRVLAQVHLDARLRGKLDPSDVVQQTMLRACAGFDELRGRDPGLVAAWLRTILARTLADTVRDLKRARRDVGRERRKLRATLAGPQPQWRPSCTVALNSSATSCRRKMILTGQLASAPDIARFRAEAEAAANLVHPNILPVFEVGEHDGQQFFTW